MAARARRQRARSATDRRWRASRVAIGVAVGNARCSNISDLLRTIRDRGARKDDRTWHGHAERVRLSDALRPGAGFPVVTTKKLHLRSIIHELLWFLKGDTNVEYLRRERRHDLGRVGGRERRSRPGVRRAMARLAGGRRPAHRPDQRALDLIRADPNSRRIIVSAWNVGEIDQMALAPCHALFQFYVAQGRLSLQLYQRSADVFLGVPFNIASYALLLHMMAQQTSLRPGRADLDRRRLPPVSRITSSKRNEQLTRQPLPLPRLADQASAPRVCSTIGSRISSSPTIARMPRSRRRLPFERPRSVAGVTKQG